MRPLTSRGLRPASIAVLCVSMSLQAQKPAAPPLADVVKAAADYVVKYSQVLQATSAEEEWMQMDTSGGKVNHVRRLNSDVVMVGLNDGAVFTFRDVYAIDQKPIGARTGRLLKLFTDPPAPPARALESAQDLTDAGFTWYVTKFLHAMDIPLLPLELLKTKFQANVTFKLDSVKTVNGAQVAILKFTEAPGVNLLGTPAGVPVTGRFSIEMPSGAVRQADVIASNESMTLRATTDFTFDKTLSLWVPLELTQRFDISSSTAAVEQVHEHGAFETHARYTKYAQAKIDPDRIH